MFSFAEVPLQQMKAPQSPIIVKGLQNVEVEENAPATFSCLIAGTPSTFIVKILNLSEGGFH